MERPRNGSDSHYVQRVCTYIIAGPISDAEERESGREVGLQWLLVTDRRPPRVVGFGANISLLTLYIPAGMPGKGIPAR